VGIITAAAAAANSPTQPSAPSSTNAVTADLINLIDDLKIASGEDIEREAGQIIAQTAQRVASVSRAKAPKKTGKLANSIHVRYLSPLSVEVGPNVDYGVFQEFGTGTRGEFPTAMYQIKPKKPGGVLVFQVDGKTVFARVVNHPGIPPHPYMRPAFEEVLGDTATKLIESGLAQITKGPNAK